ncbi:MAG: SDR family NAD(P)-dependent oxidoreductase [Anaerolineaceae bacterium]
MNSIRFENMRPQTVLITGAAGGLGKAFALECASRGWNLVLTDRSESLINTLAESLERGYGIRVQTFACDLTDPVKREDLFRQVVSTGTRLTMLVNVAGIDHEGTFMAQTSQQIQEILRINVEAPLAMIHTAVQYRDRRSAFRIINVASLAAFYPMPSKATYASSKRFLLNFSMALNQEFKEMNATVTALCPAGLPTTPECIKAIDAQGLAGALTTVDTGRAAYLTLEASLQGKPVVIPGFFNRLIHLAGSLVPANLLAAIIGKRWGEVRQKRVSRGELAAV